MFTRSAIDVGSDARAYPIFLRLEGKHVLVVGGGPVGERKIDGLLAAGARVVVVSPEVTEGVRRRVGADLEWRNRAFEPADLDGASLVVAATDQDAVNARVVEEARKRDVWVNDATSKERSDFMLPATVRRGDLALAVSTGGGSPAYARLVREMLEGVFGEEHVEMVRMLSELRPRVMAAFPDSADRKAFWDRLVTEETLQMIKNNEIAAVEAQVAAWLSS